MNRTQEIQELGKMLTATTEKDKQRLFEIHRKLTKIMLNGSVVGISKIAQERIEQVMKHGYTAQKDLENNADGQLASAAAFCLTTDPLYWPSNWDLEYRDKLVQKSSLQRTIIAGALLAAEIDVRNHPNYGEGASHGTE